MAAEATWCLRMSKTTDAGEKGAGRGQEVNWTQHYNSFVRWPWPQAFPLAPICNGMALRCEWQRSFDGWAETDGASCEGARTSDCTRYALQSILVALLTERMMKSPELSIQVIVICAFHDWVTLAVWRKTKSRRVDSVWARTLWRGKLAVFSGLAFACEVEVDFCFSFVVRIAIPPHPPPAIPPLPNHRFVNDLLQLFGTLFLD